MSPNCILIPIVLISLIGGCDTTESKIDARRKALTSYLTITPKRTASEVMIVVNFPSGLGPEGHTEVSISPAGKGDWRNLLTELEVRSTFDATSTVTTKLTTDEAKSDLDVKVKCEYCIQTGHSSRKFFDVEKSFSIPK